MVGRAPRHLCQPLCCLQLGIILVTLVLCAVILPVGSIGVGEGGGELLDEGLVRLELSQQRLGFAAPEYAAMLLAGSADATDASEGGVLLL